MAGQSGEPVLAPSGSAAGNLLPNPECKISQEGIVQISASIGFAKTALGQAKNSQGLILRNWEQ